MIIKEENRELPNIESEYFIVQSISANKVNGMKDLFPYGYVYSKGDCVGTHKTFNLVVKKEDTQLSTYEEMREAFVELETMCFLGHYKKLAIQIIDNKFEGIDYSDIKTMLKDVFQVSEVEEILVCRK